MFLRLYLPWQWAHSSLQLLIQPWICAPGTHYDRMDRGSVQGEVAQHFYTWPALESNLIPSDLESNALST